jgi:hypothetical protein
VKTERPWSVAVDLFDVELDQEVDDRFGDALPRDEDQGGGEVSSSVAEQAGGLAQRDVLPIGVVVAGVEGATDVAVG